MTNRTKGAIIKGCAITLDVVAPLVATLTQFPLWIEKSADATMSGLCLFFVILSCLPFLKQIRELFKSPSAWLMFTILFAFLVMMRNIIDQMIVVTFIGMVANIAGAGIYTLGKNISEREDKNKETK